MSRAIYPGSFDPPTHGHFDLIERGAQVFDQLIVAVVQNTGKQSLFSPEERVDMIQKVSCGLPNVEVTKFDGLTVDFARKNGCGVILRGVRSMADIEYEAQLAFTNKSLAPDIETVLMLSSPEFAYVSSRWIKEATLLGGDISAFVPDLVAQKLKEKLLKQR